jgi:hypothetical protein
LPPPEMQLECAVGGGDRAFAWAWANVMRGVLPLMERFDIATAAELHADTLAERLLAEVNAAQGIVVSPPMIGAWAHMAQGTPVRFAKDE